MKKGFTPVIILLIIALVVIVGAVVVLKKSKTVQTQSAATTPVTTQTSPTSMAPTTAVTTGNLESTFLDMIKAGQSLECTWQSKTNTSLQPGKVWFGKGKARSQLMTSSKAAGQGVEANAIMRDGNVYAWVQIAGMAPMGFMMNQTDVAGMGKNLTPEQLQQAQQYQQKVSFNCSPWVYDESTFTLPANVQFRSNP